MDCKENIEEEELNDYILNLAGNPKNMGKIPEGERSVCHSYKGPCGETMTFFLKINNNSKSIEKARFVTDGCEAAKASASQTMKLIEGRFLNFAENLKPEEIDEALGGLPADHKHCAELAIRTLQHTIRKYRNENDKKKSL